MKKIFILMVTMLVASAVNAQEITVSEPEFIGNYCILTGNDSYEVLPKENGKIGRHQNKARKFGNLLSNAGHLGVLGGAAAVLGSGGAVASGIQVMSTAATVGSAGDAVGILAGSQGMDVIFSGGSSPYKVEAGKDVRVIVKNENNEYDPMDIYRVVRFATSKKERRVQWFEFDRGLLGTDDAGKAGFLLFTGKKYGSQSYLLTIPASQLEEGEYGIFFVNVVSSIEIPVGTFSVK